MYFNIPQNDWLDFFKEQTDNEYFIKINDFLEKEQKLGKVIYPSRQNIFSAFELCELKIVKVFILGQDPYHNINQANGLAFSVSQNIKLPPSLQNIYSEIGNDLNIKMNFNNGNLEVWAKQGVFLLNSFLSVQAHNPLSHSKIGWEIFTDKVIQYISDTKENIVFILWGSFAQQKRHLIKKEKHFILECPHPSPFSVHRGFFGCKHFSKANEYLLKHEKPEITWQV